MTHFIRDNTSLGDDTLLSRMQNPAQNKAVISEDWRRFRQALLDIQEYLRSGDLDASATITATTITADTMNAEHVAVTIDDDPDVGPEIDYTGYRGGWFTGIDVANTPTSRDYVLAGQRGTYAFHDGVTTSGSATLTSASGGGFVSADIGAPISGAGIPNGTTIAAVGSTTSLTLSALATASATGVEVTIERAITAADILYLKHRGGLSPTFGVGVTPPDGSARLQVSPNDAEPTMGTVRLRRGPSQTGNVLALYDSAPTDRWWIDKDFYISGAHSLGGAVVLRGDATNNRPLLMIDKDLAASVYGFEYPSGGGGVIRFRRTTTNTNVFQVGTDGTLFIYEAITLQKLATVQSGIKGLGSAGAAPSSGTHARGEVIFNADPIAGGFIGWVCVAAGTPGTWKAWGAIEA
jgi:hypothetical protein